VRWVVLALVLFPSVVSAAQYTYQCGFKPDAPIQCSGYVYSVDGNDVRLAGGAVSNLYSPGGLSELFQYEMRADANGCGVVYFSDNAGISGFNCEVGQSPAYYALMGLAGLVAAGLLFYSIQQAFLS